VVWSFAPEGVDGNSCGGGVADKLSNLHNPHDVARPAQCVRLDQTCPLALTYKADGQPFKAQMSIIDFKPPSAYLFPIGLRKLINLRQSSWFAKPFIQSLQWGIEGPAPFEIMCLIGFVEFGDTQFELALHSGSRACFLSGSRRRLHQNQKKAQAYARGLNSFAGWSEFS